MCYRYDKKTGRKRLGKLQKIPRRFLNYKRRLGSQDDCSKTPTMGGVFS
ncbi:hypothetical protein [Flavobacterium sp. NG2]